MAKNKEIKTNAMRILESMKIPFTHYTYECEEFIDGIQIADTLNLPYEKVYKTLVTVGNSKWECSNELRDKTNREDYI